MDKSSSDWQSVVFPQWYDTKDLECRSIQAGWSSEFNVLHQSRSRRVTASSSTLRDHRRSFAACCSLKVQQRSQVTRDKIVSPTLSFNYPRSLWPTLIKCRMHLSLWLFAHTDRQRYTHTYTYTIVHNSPHSKATAIRCEWMCSAQVSDECRF